jgi:Flp pilus assembly pilin Flp
LLEKLNRFYRGEEAATAVEYAVMLALFIASLIVLISSVGGKSGGMWGGIKTNMASYGIGG